VSVSPARRERTASVLSAGLGGTCVSLGTPEKFGTAHWEYVEIKDRFRPYVLTVMSGTGGDGERRAAHHAVRNHFAFFVRHIVIKRARQNIGDLLVIVGMRIDVVAGLESDKL